MEKETSNGRLTILLIISMVLWGLSWPANKVMRSFGDPVTLGVMRYSVVIISMIPMLLFMKVRFRISKMGVLFVVISGMLMSVYNYTFLEGLHKGDSGAGGILVTTLNPILAYSLGILVARRRPTTNETIGILLGAIAGVVLLKLWDNINILRNPSNVLFLASAVLWSVMSKFTSRSKEFGNPLAFTWWMYVVTLLTLIPFVDFGTLGKLATLPEPKFWWNLLFTSVVVTSFATTMYFIATSRIGAERASSFIFTVPLCAGISALCILGEPLLWHTITGGVIGIGAVYVLNKKNTAKKEYRMLLFGNYRTSKPFKINNGTIEFSEEESYSGSATLTQGRYELLNNQLIALLSHHKKNYLYLDNHLYEFTSDISVNIHIGQSKEEESHLSIYKNGELIFSLDYMNRHDVFALPLPDPFLQMEDYETSDFAYHIAEYAKKIKSNPKIILFP